MLDSDISTADAVCLLSYRDDQLLDSPGGLSRRKFLQLVGWGIGGGAALGTLGAALDPALIPSQLRDAWAAPPIGPTDGIVVSIFMHGGNDGLNTVVPYGNGTYYSRRATGGVAIAQENVLAINDQIGLHPNLPFVKSMYDMGNVAIVQGIGYPNPDLSHFNSTGLWMYGSAAGGLPTSGWLGRWLDGMGGDYDLLRAAVVGSSVPLHMVGQARRACAVPPGGVEFGGGTKPEDLRMYTALRAMSGSPSGRGQWHDMIASTLSGLIDVGQATAPSFKAPLPSGDIQKKLTVAARLINADIGLRLVDIGWGDFDSHSGQPAMHNARMSELNTALSQFFSTLDPKFHSRVTVMTMSEFGRTPNSNNSSGTDHGTASAHFVIGAKVKGGVYGQGPSLDTLDANKRLIHTVDFRSYYASVIDGWLGGGASSVLGGSFENLGLFDGVPGGSDTLFGLPPTPGLPGVFVPVPPARIYDTRNAIGVARTTPLDIKELGTAQVLGVGGVPATGVTAVALNVTATLAQDNTWLTVWPGGEQRPWVANVHAPAGRDVPNFSIVKVGPTGTVNVISELNPVNAIVDVMGYFTSDSGHRFSSLTAARLLDSRNGVARSGPLADGETFDLQVSEQGGVPKNASSVVLNVTVAEPSGSGYFTVWPAGEARSETSVLNFAAGQVAANMSILKLGAGGKVSLYNAGGSAHAIIDVLGYFSSSGGSRYTPVPAKTLLDTRPTGPLIAEQVVTLFPLGQGYVPGVGVKAIALNLTGDQASAQTYMTAYPSGEPRPPTSNLNLRAGETRANLSIVRLGANGGVDVFNEAGTVQLIADVVGFFD